MLREVVLSFAGVGAADNGPCTPERRARCEFEWGEYTEFVCKTCERNTNGNKGKPDAEQG